MLDGKYSFEYGLIFRWIRKGISKHHQVENEAFGFPWKSYFFFFFWKHFQIIFGSFLGNHSLRMEISFERILSRCFYEREYRFFPPFVRFSIRIAIRPIVFIIFFFNHISFLLSQARFSQLNAAWLIRPFLHSSCPTKRSFQPFSLSVIYKYHFHSDSRSKRKKKKKKKITHQRPVHLDDTQKKETKKSRQIFQTINPSSCLVSCVYQTRGKMRLFHATCSFELLEDPPTRETDFTYVLSLI